MKMNARLIARTLLASGMAFGVTAAYAAMSDLPASQKQGDVTFITGGIGQAQADAMKHAASKYPLEVEFLRKEKSKNEYLAEVKVEIRDMHGKTILDTTSDGPFLLAELPAGKYKISAERSGITEHRNVDIAANGHRRVVFEWKS